MTPTPSGLINGHLTWQGVAAPNRPNVTSTLVLCNAGVPISYSVSTDTGGNFLIGVYLPDGTYNWRLKGGRHLANSGSLTITGGSSVQEFGTQRGGDITGDNNLVNASDFTLQKNQFGQAGNLAGDVDYNLVVNTLDFNILKGNFGQSGAASNCP
jgi:hypothetical protein